MFLRIHFLVAILVFVGSVSVRAEDRSQIAITRQGTLCMTLGHFYMGPEEWKVKCSWDDGKSWKQVDANFTPAKTRANSIVADKNGDLYVAGEYGETGLIVRVSHDQGRTWKTSDSVYERETVFRWGGGGLLVNPKGDIYSWGGLISNGTFGIGIRKKVQNKWEFTSSAPKETALGYGYHSVIDSRNRFYVFTTTLVGAFREWALATSPDGGKNWTRTTVKVPQSIRGDIGQIAIGQKDEVYLVGGVHPIQKYNTNWYVVRSLNQGRTYDVVDQFVLPPKEDWTSSGFANVAIGMNNVMYVAGGTWYSRREGTKLYTIDYAAYIRVSRDNGKTWQTVSRIKDITPLSFSSDTKGRIYLQANAGEEFRTYRSSDQGASWNLISSEEEPKK